MNENGRILIIHPLTINASGMKWTLLAGSIAAYKKCRSFLAGLSPSFRFLIPAKHIYTFFAVFFLINSLHVYAQPTTEQQTEYRKVITERAAKIINTLGLTDSGTYRSVHELVTNQYSLLNDVHEENKTQVATIKKQGLSKEQADEAVKKQEEKKMSQLAQLHQQFIAHLKVKLTEEQLEKVKDGMTYRVVPITWAAYQDMLPNLTDDQKKQIYSWLTEARELAMDAESSEKKHQVFGKYKGRINNYLSAAGYDMKKESLDWEKRVKERAASNKAN
jgi:hypothetical protein